MSRKARLAEYAFKKAFDKARKEGKPLGFCHQRPKTSVYCTSPGMCMRCGWNPTVEEDRKATIRWKMGV